MPRCKPIEIQAHFPRQRRKGSELDVTVAADTWVRRPRGLIFTPEIFEHHFFIFARNIHDPERNPDPVGNIRSAFHVLLLIRTVTPFSIPAPERGVLIPDAHDRSGDFMSGLLQKHGGNRGIDASAQSDQNLHFTKPPVN